MLSPRGNMSVCSVMRSESAMGQSRPNWAVRAMSGLPPVAIRLRTCRIGSFVPTSDMRIIGV